MLWGSGEETTKENTDDVPALTSLFISIYSARIVREEDEEQLRLIGEEERREWKRKLAKKRKLSHR
jgi:hypothetical protein